MASAYRIWQFVREHALRDRPHAPLWLGKAYLVPAGMYASQVWAKIMLRKARNFQVNWHIKCEVKDTSHSQAREPGASNNPSDPH
eukprot:1150374-Pelagomonas_calceolata.AAC.1